MALERPLVGEPLGLDLLNTSWIARGGPVDALGDLDGTQAWLDEAGIDQTATEPVREALITAREAIRAHVDQEDSPQTRSALNKILAWGRTWPVLGADGPGTATELADPDHRAGWLAALDYLDLLSKDGTRVRRCAHPECVLHFYDTSPKRSRRWCSMAVCGNRAKAARHYARTRPSTADAQ